LGYTKGFDMSVSNYFDIYKELVFQLASTIVVKSTETADLINSSLTAQSIVVDEYTPSTWKYYLNICGQYHSSDTMMTVKSMDTLEEINFTIANLAIHRATARGYAYGTRGYNELVALYPKQEMLIKGILFPADMTTALAADNGTILMYAPGSVEDQEYNLINKLQTWISNWYATNINPNYVFVDELYLPVMLGMMYQHMVPAIFNFRLEACKTIEAHSFHIKQYLASHGALDQYINSMTLNQQLYFYRNIAYLERNPGKSEIFDTLIEHTMTQRNIPIAEYTMKHDVSAQPDVFYPTPTFKMTALNIQTTAAVPDVISLSTMLDKEASLARDNVLYQADALTDITAELTYSSSNVELTKALESAMVDYTNSTPYTMSDILLNHWLYWSTSGIYTAYISFDDPVTGDPIQLIAKDAYTFMWYAFVASYGFTSDYVPELVAWRAQINPMATVADLMSVVPNTFDSNWATLALTYQPTITKKIISTEDFWNTCQEIYFSANYQRKLIAFQEKYMDKAYMHNMVSRIYSDTVCRVEPDNTTYDQWFKDRNINIANFTQTQLGDVWVNIVSSATGADLVTTDSVANLQKAMVGMMTKLSSYSVQFMSQINDSDLRPIDLPVIRPGDISGSGSDHMDVEVIVAGVNHEKSTLNHHVWADVDWPNVDSDFESVQKHHLKVDIPVQVMGGKPLTDKHFRIDSARIRARYVGKLELNDRGIIPVPGIAEYLELPIEDSQRFKDMNGNFWNFGIPSDITLAVAIANNILDGADWVEQ